MDTLQAIMHDLHERLSLPLPQHDMSALSDAFQGGVVSLVRAMQQHTRLTCKLTLGKVRAGGPESAPAWVALPLHVPLYGTRAFDEHMFTIFVRAELFTRRNVQALIYVVAHEFSHILLHAVQSPYRESEIATDLCAMLLGYDHVVLAGVQYTIEQEYVCLKPWWRPPLFKRSILVREDKQLSVGYLTEEDMRYAARYVAFLRERA